jgi:hypothetical protein
MAAEDYWPYGFEYDTDDYDDDGFHEKTCNRCGTDNLRWVQARGKRNQKCWVLVDIDTDEVHVCPMAAPSDFKGCTT